MQLTVEDVSSVKKVLQVEISEQDVTKEIDNAYKELKKGAKLKGFRPGKAPRNVLEKYYSKDVQANVLSTLIQDSIVEAVQESGLQIIGEPKLDLPDFKENEPLIYKATVEIAPEIGDVDYKGIKLKKTMYKVRDEEIDMQLKLMQEKMADKKKIEEDRPAQDGDFLQIDYEGLVDGQPLGEEKTKDFVLKLGDATISEDFDNHLKGMKAGEEKEFSVMFTNDDPNKAFAGQVIDFKLILNEIREQILPEINDELAKNFSQFETLEELKTEITKNLQEGYEKRTEQELNEQMFKHLLGQVEFEVPDTLVEVELDGIIKDAERMFEQYNMSLEQIGQTKEELRANYRDTAVMQVKRFLVLDQIVKQESLEAEEAELDDAFEQMAKQFGATKEQVKKIYEANDNQIQMIKQGILEKKAMKLIVSSSEIEEVEPELEETAEETAE